MNWQKIEPRRWFFIWFNDDL